mgnify:CR=1 FL=1
MPVSSFVGYPASGQGKRLTHQLRQLKGCEVFPAEGQDLLLLVTDTADEHDEEKLQRRLSEMRNIQCLAMTFAYAEEGGSE